MLIKVALCSATLTALNESRFRPALIIVVIARERSLEKALDALIPFLLRNVCVYFSALSSKYIYRIFKLRQTSPASRKASLDRNVGRSLKDNSVFSSRTSGQVLEDS